MSSCMDQDRSWEEQSSRDYHNEIRAERDKLRAEVERLTRERDNAIREWTDAVKAHGLCEARAEAAERKLAMAVEFIKQSNEPDDADVQVFLTELEKADD